MTYDTDITVRTSSEVKHETQEIFDALGIDANTAVNMFLRQVIIHHGLPFRVSLDCDDKTVKCKACQSDELTTSITNYFSDLGGQYVIIENVPCLECRQCGEKFFSASVMRKIDDIIASVRNVAGTITVINYK